MAATRTFALTSWSFSFILFRALRAQVSTILRALLAFIEHVRQISPRTSDIASMLVDDMNKQVTLTTRGRERERESRKRGTVLGIEQRFGRSAWRFPRDLDSRRVSGAKSRSPRASSHVAAIALEMRMLPCKLNRDTVSSYRTRPSSSSAISPSRGFAPRRFPAFTAFPRGRESANETCTLTLTSLQCDNSRRQFPTGWRIEIPLDRLRSSRIDEREREKKILAMWAKVNIVVAAFPALFLSLILFSYLLQHCVKTEAAYAA